MARYSLILLWILLLNAILSSIALAQNLTEVNAATEDNKKNVDNQSSWWHKTLKVLNDGLSSIGLAQNVTEVDTATEDVKKNVDDQSNWWHRPATTLKILKTVGVAIGVAMAVTLLAPIIVVISLWIIGFSLWGVLAGSCAACCHSSIGDVPFGSWFSCLQSMGACGSIHIYLCIGLLCGLPAGGISGYYAWFYFS